MRVAAVRHLPARNPDAGTPALDVILTVTDTSGADR